MGSLSGFALFSLQERNHSNDEENDKAYFRDPSGGSGDSAEAEHTCNDRNDQEYNGIVEHDVGLGLWFG
jgi:hypothetical protein